MNHNTLKFEKHRKTSVIFQTKHLSNNILLKTSRELLLSVALHPSICSDEQR